MDDPMPYVTFQMGRKVSSCTMECEVSAKATIDLQNDKSGGFYYCGSFYHTH